MSKEVRVIQVSETRQKSFHFLKDLMVEFLVENHGVFEFCSSSSVSKHRIQCNLTEVDSDSVIGQLSGEAPTQVDLLDTAVIITVLINPGRQASPQTKWF